MNEVSEFDPGKALSAYPDRIQVRFREQAGIMLDELRSFPYVRYSTEQEDASGKRVWVVESRGPQWYHDLFRSHGKPRFITRSGRGGEAQAAPQYLSRATTDALSRSS